MNKRLASSSFIFAAATLLFGASVVCAQDDPEPKVRLSNPATVRGTMGGESHASYVIRARRGQRMTVSISWRKDGDNQAGFSISRSPNFFSAEPLGFGEESNEGKDWTGRIPKTGNYYIYVTAHPIADYVLRVRLK